MAHATEPGDTLRLGGLGLLGIATAIAGMGDLITRMGIGWGVATLLLAVGVLSGAFARTAAVHGVAALSGALLCAMGVLALLLGRPPGYAFLRVALGVATLAVALTARRMRTHPGHVRTPFTRKSP